MELYSIVSLNIKQCEGLQAYVSGHRIHTSLVMDMLKLKRLNRLAEAREERSSAKLPFRSREIGFVSILLG